MVVRDPGDFARMKRGAILVAPATDPSWTPLFTLASGVIVEVGGVLSHASTIAREYGLPAIANVKNATRRLRTGDRVRLDAVNGIVHRLPKNAPIILSFPERRFRSLTRWRVWADPQLERCGRHGVAVITVIAGGPMASSGMVPPCAVGSALGVVSASRAWAGPAHLIGCAAWC